MMVVRPRAAASCASCTSFSLSASRADVASSSNKILGVLDDGTGDGHSLLLTSRELCTPLADQRVVAVGQTRVEGKSVGLLGSGLDLLLGHIVAAKGDVGLDMESLSPGRKNWPCACPRRHHSPSEEESRKGSQGSFSSCTHGLWHLHSNPILNHQHVTTNKFKSGQRKCESSIVGCCEKKKKRMEEGELTWRSTPESLRPYQHIS